MLRDACKLFILLILWWWLLPTTLFAGDRRHADVDRIGIRKINGRVAWIFPNFVSFKREMQMGAEYAHMIEQTLKLIEDPMVVKYIDSLGQQIVAHSDAKVPFTIKVIDTDDVNAFALPGGYFYVNSGLILEAENEAELAGVLAHEIAHVTARHATERLTKGTLLQYAAIPALFIGGYWAQMGIRSGLGMGLSLSVLGITRANEREADQLGTQYLWNSGYEMSGFVTFFQKLQAKKKNTPGKFASFFRTHPPTGERIRDVNREISFLPLKNEYKVNTSRFFDVQNRLNKLSIVVGSDHGPNRPTLKRKTTSPKKGEKKKPTMRRKGEPK